MSQYEIVIVRNKKSCNTDKRLNILSLLNFPTSPTAPSLEIRAKADLWETQQPSIDPGTATLLLTFPMPTLEDVNYLHGALDAVILDCYLRFNYPTGAGQLRLPFWVIGYWRRAYDIVEAKRVWSSALEWLEKAGEKDLLARIP